MWVLIIGAILVVGGWLIYCHAKVYRQWHGVVNKEIQGLKDAWDALPKCPDPPLPPKHNDRRNRRPGQVYIGRCLTSYEPDLWFIYVLLSRDKEQGDGLMYWKVAQFMSGDFGAQVVMLTDGEIDKVGCVGHIAALMKREN